jgi:xanthine/CO dehydrogenase XdhC/CoxF family maturation factor
MIRRATREDADAIWKVLEPMIRAGETYALPREMKREDALTYWFHERQEAFVAAEGREIVGDAAARPELVIVGKEPVALALARLGALLNFTVTTVDPLLSVTDFPGADRVLRRLDFSRLTQSAERYVAVVSKGRFDEEAIEQALRTGSAYVALVANQKRGQEVLRSLELKGCTVEMLSRVQVPAGIDIGAETPQEIALSIMAEIVRERRKAIRHRGELPTSSRA